MCVGMEYIDVDGDILAFILVAETSWPEAVTLVSNRTGRHAKNQVNIGWQA